ncbi:MAG: DUF4010 domain-containing protein [archaeon]
MLELFEYITRTTAAAGFSILFGAVVWRLKMTYHDPDEDLHENALKLFKGVSYGGFKLFLLYFLIMPLVPELPLSAKMQDFLHILFIGLVFILGVELFAYAFTHFAKYEKEIYALGIIGGITRSEAVTAQFMDEVKANPSVIPEAVDVVLIASTVMFYRNALLILAASIPLFYKTAIPLFAMAIVSTILVKRSVSSSEKQDIKLKAVSLRTAFKIVVFFAIVTAAIDFAAKYGSLGLYAIAAVGALGGALPVVFSTLTMLRVETISLDTAALMILIATIVAYVNDIPMLYIFKQKEFAKSLLKEQWLPPLVGIFTIYLMMQGLSIDLGFLDILFLIPPLYTGVAAAALAAAFVTVLYYRRRRTILRQPLPPPKPYRIPPKPAKKPPEPDEKPKGPDFKPKIDSD